jgi:6-phosphogluconolactonase
MARDTLLRHVPVPPAQVHRIPGEEPEPGRAAERYAQELRRVFAAHGRLEAGRPRFDLVLLGMGADGHTASLFPGTDAVHETTRLVAAPWVATLGTHRLTLTPPVLNAADRVVFLVTGSDKAEALAAVLEGPRQPDVYPSQAIAPRAGALVWLVDHAAAARLTAAAER